MSGDKIRILLIEDNPGDRFLVRSILLKTGDMAGRCELVDATRLQQGLDLLGTGDWHLILLDLTLPDSEGIETFEQVSQRASGTPILILSGLDDQSLAMKAVKSGAQDYLVKGQIDFRTLNRAIEQAVERKAAGSLRPAGPC